MSQHQRKGRRQGAPGARHGPPTVLSNLQSLILHSAPICPIYGDEATSITGTAHFRLADLWQSYEAWSAYGCEVPLRIQVDGVWQEVIQCYTPSLSGLQLFGADHTRQIGGEAAAAAEAPSCQGDADASEPDAGSGGASADCSDDEGCSGGGAGSRAASVAGSCASSAYTCSTASTASTASDSEDGEEACKGSPTAGGESAAATAARRLARGSVLRGQSLGEPAAPLFEYSEVERPHLRQPLHDQVLQLAEAFPGLLTLDSRDLHPTSWFAVTWVPIYRVPAVPDPAASRDLAANFLTFHSLTVPAQRLAAAPADCCSIAPLPPLLDPAGAAAVAWRTELARQQLLGDALSQLAAQQVQAQQAQQRGAADAGGEPGAQRPRPPVQLPLAAACLRPFAFMPWKAVGRTWVDDWNLQRQHLPMIAAAGSWVERRRVQLPDFDFYSATYRPLPTGYQHHAQHYRC